MKRLICNFLVLASVLCFSTCTKTEFDNGVFVGISEEEFYNLSFGYYDSDMLTIAKGITLEKQAENQIALIIKPDAVKGVVKIAIKREEGYLMCTFVTTHFLPKGAKFKFDVDSFSSLRYCFEPFFEDFVEMTEEEFNNLLFEYKYEGQLTIAAGIKFERKNRTLSLVIESKAEQGLLQVAIRYGNKYYLRAFSTESYLRYVFDSDYIWALRYSFEADHNNLEYLDCEGGLFYYDFNKELFSGYPSRTEPLTMDLGHIWLNDYLVVGLFPPAWDLSLSHSENSQILSTFRSNFEQFIHQTNLFKPVDWMIGLGTVFPGSEGTTISYSIVFIKTKEKKKCSELKEIIQTIESYPSVAYADFAYSAQNLKYLHEDCNGMCNDNIMGGSSFFTVYLINGSTMSDLESIMQETNTRIQARMNNKYFTLVADKTAAGNALQMANYFSETGKFAAQTWFKSAHDRSYNPASRLKMKSLNDFYFHIKNAEFMGIYIENQ